MFVESGCNSDVICPSRNMICVRTALKVFWSTIQDSKSYKLIYHVPINVLIIQYASNIFDKLQMTWAISYDTSFPKM